MAQLVRCVATFLVASLALCQNFQNQDQTDQYEQQMDRLEQQMDQFEEQMEQYQEQMEQYIRSTANGNANAIRPVPPAMPVMPNGVPNVNGYPPNQPNNNFGGNRQNIGDCSNSFQICSPINEFGIQTRLYSICPGNSVVPYIRVNPRNQMGTKSIV